MMKEGKKGRWENSEIDRGSLISFRDCLCLF